METLRLIEAESFTVKIYNDEHAESPREWDNLGTMVCWHRNYNLGDKHNFEHPDDFKEYIKDNPSYVLPLYLYDHSGITISTTPFSCHWDSGKVGYIFCSTAKAKEEFNLSDGVPLETRVINNLKAEVKTYDDYITNQVYGYEVFEGPASDVNMIDSCWGFYGNDLIHNGMIDHFPEPIVKKIKESTSCVWG